jgi:cell shape-determining protein MreD
VLKFASTVGLAYGVANLKRRIRTAVTQAALAAVALVFFLAAAIFGLIALHIWLAGEIGPVASAGLIAAILLVIAAVFALLARREPRRQPPPADDVGEQLGTTLQQSYARLAQASGGSPLTNPVVLGMGAAFLAGILLGRRK